MPSTPTSPLFDTVKKVFAEEGWTFAEIEGRRVDVVTRGEMISAGSTVRVLDVESNRVVVAEIDPGKE